jgi:hypothetical protein
MTEARNINCSRANRLLHERLEGALAPREDELRKEQQLQAHWQRCPGCAEHARQLLGAMQALRSAPAPEPRAPLAARIRAAAAQALRETPAPAARLRPAPYWAAAALATAVLVLAFALHGPSLTPVHSHAAGAGLSRAATPPGTAPALPGPTSAAAGANVAATVRVAALPTTPAPASHSYRLQSVSMRYPAPPAARPAPQPAYVRVRATMADTAAADPDDTAGATAPEADRVARVDVDGDQGTSEADNSGDFAKEVVGGLVADAVLSTYLDGAPANVKITPAVLTTTGNGD